MKLAFLTLATVYGQEDELKPPPGKDYVDFGDGEGFMSCTEFFAGNSTFSTFQAEDGLRIGVILYIFITYIVHQNIIQHFLRFFLMKTPFKVVQYL